MVPLLIGTHLVWMKWTAAVFGAADRGADDPKLSSHAATIGPHS
jgi:hypothetical protein